MDRHNILTGALVAVSDQQAEARRQMDQAASLGSEDLVAYWTEQLEALKVTRQGLLDMLWEVNREQP